MRNDENTVVVSLQVSLQIASIIITRKNYGTT